MTAFDINHNGYLEVNEQLYAAVGRAGQILETLETALKNIPEAIKGNAQEIWQQEQAEWRKGYTAMTEKLDRNTMASINVHQIFKEGDMHSTRIMLS